MGLLRAQMTNARENKDHLPPPKAHTAPPLSNLLEVVGAPSMVVVPTGRHLPRAQTPCARRRDDPPPLLSDLLEVVGAPSMVAARTERLLPPAPTTSVRKICR